MAILNHTHALVVGEKTTHLDSYGRHFGDTDHDEILTGLTLNDEVTITEPVSHRHRHIEEIVDSTSNIHTLAFRPPSEKEAEREIVLRSK